MFFLMEEGTIAVQWVGFGLYAHIRFFLCKMSKGWKNLFCFSSGLVLQLYDVTVVKPVICYLLLNRRFLQDCVKG